MKQFGWILIYVILGMTFWFPSILIHGFRGREFGVVPSDVILVTLVPIITAVSTFEILSRAQRGVSSRASIASWMLLGIGFFGPPCIMISASFSGGGLLLPERWLALASAVLLFIPYTFMMSTYDGTLGALVIVTMCFIIVDVIGLTRRLRPITKSAG
jgi:hypothetical protein